MGILRWIVLVGFWVMVLGIGAALLWGWLSENVSLRTRLQGWWSGLRGSLGGSSHLCRSCRYNNPRDCWHRIRPFATSCEDYQRR